MTEQTINLNNSQPETIKPEDIYKCLDINDLPGEVWKDIPGYEGLYQVSNLGRVKRLSIKMFYKLGSRKDIRITPEIINQIKLLYESGEYSQTDLGKRFGFSQSHIFRILKGLRGNGLDGRIRRERLMKIRLTFSGYCATELTKDHRSSNCQVHRLVASAFIPNPDNKPQVNHINNLRTDNRLENLEWVTPKENTEHAISIGRFEFCRMSGEKNGNSKLTGEQVKKIREMYSSGNFSYVDLSCIFNVSPHTLHSVVTRQIWKHVA